MELYHVGRTLTRRQSSLRQILPATTRAMPIPTNLGIAVYRLRFILRSIYLSVSVDRRRHILLSCGPSSLVSYRLAALHRKDLYSNMTSVIARAMIAGRSVSPMAVGELNPS